MRNTLMVVNFHISERGSRVAQDMCIFLLITVAAGQAKAGENTEKY